MQTRCLHQVACKGLNPSAPPSKSCRLMQQRHARTFHHRLPPGCWAQAPTLSNSCGWQRRHRPAPGRRQGRPRDAQLRDGVLVRQPHLAPDEGLGVGVEVGDVGDARPCAAAGQAGRAAAGGALRLVAALAPLALPLAGRTREGSHKRQQHGRDTPMCGVHTDILARRAATWQHEHCRRQHAGHHLGRSETKHAQSMCTPHTILHPLEFADSSPV